MYHRTLGALPATSENQWNPKLLRQGSALSAIIFFFISLYIYIYIFFFLLHSMVTQLHIHVYILFSHVFHHNRLDRVPSATQQDAIANPSQRQRSASIYPKLPVPPTPPPSPPPHPTAPVAQPLFFFFW